MFKKLAPEQKKELIELLKSEMKQFAKELNFERAAEIRDEIGRLEEALKN